MPTATAPGRADVDGWGRVFPELADAPAELTGLLQRLDDIQPPPPPAPLRLPAEVAGSAGGEPTAAGPFGELPTRLVDGLGDRVAELVAAHPFVAAPRAVRDAVRTDLAATTARLVSRWLLAQLHEQRSAGLLEGATPEERYDHFLAQASSPAGVGRLRARAPELVRHAEQVTTARATALLDQLEATHRALPRLAAHLDGVAPGDRVVAMRPGLGDTHGRGHSVTVLELGSGARVVVKPRDLRVERGVGLLCARAGAEAGLDLRHPAVVCGEGVGWVEHVAPGRPGADWWRAVGVLLAVVHLLDGTDLHYENLLTDTAGRPVLADTEAVLTPRLLGGEPDDGRLLGVAATGLLSVPLPGGSGSRLDAGALAYRPGASPYGTWSVERPGRDDMSLRMVPADVVHPAPTAGVERGPRQHAELVDGFATTLERVLAHREDWSARVRAHLGAGQVRYLHRPTMLYAQVQRAATHPLLAVTDARRRRALGRLAVLAPRSPWPLVAAEVRQLMLGDLPSFRVDVRGRSLLDGHGDDTGVACHPPLERTLSAVANLDERHVATQVAVVERSLQDR